MQPSLFACIDGRVLLSFGIAAFIAVSIVAITTVIARWYYDREGRR